MKKIILTLVLSISILGTTFAQENQQDNSINLYTFFVNVVNEQFRFPLIGFINIAKGSHNSPQIGFINWNQQKISPLQLGFVNTAGDDMTGLQMGFINTAVKSVNGVQLGFVNTAVGEEIKGLQLGFINTTVNRFNGTQIAFVNTTKQLNGMQFGFINYADTIKSGIPVGLLSIVRKGGYKAIELGVSEISPFNISFKIGVEKFYTSFIVAYNPFRDGIREQIILGGGFGTIIPLSKNLYLNPELTSYKEMNESSQNYASIIPYLGWNITSNLSIVVGPSAVWAYNNKSVEAPFYKITEYSINDENKLYFGARMGLRFRW
ncbi:MAG: hypothetical protein LBS25_08870 [Candidatus Symbiothrix sp.]|jgi:hypothetical protein|nr:hypothetical protein [Candidatus Symbiothrix sp.]